MNTMKEYRNPRNLKVPAITIRTNSSICLHKKALEEFNLEELKSVSLHFDAEQGVIGIKPTDEDPAAFRVAREKSGTTTISCKAFLEECGIKCEGGSRVLAAEWDADKEMIVVKVK